MYLIWSPLFQLHHVRASIRGAVPAARHQHPHDMLRLRHSRSGCQQVRRCSIVRGGAVLVSGFPLSIMHRISSSIRNKGKSKHLGEEEKGSLENPVCGMYDTWYVCLCSPFLFLNFVPYHDMISSGTLRCLRRATCRCGWSAATCSPSSSSPSPSPSTPRGGSSSGPDI